MAMSKASRVSQWWAEVRAACGANYLAQPTWLDRARRQAAARVGKNSDNQAAPNHPSLYRQIGLSIRLTPHAEFRLAQRNLSAEEIGYVLLHGQTWHKAGAIIIHLSEKDVPKSDQSNQRWRKLIGTTVVMTTEEERLLTAYRNRCSGLQHIKRKPDYGWN